jgi:putative sterol carrier protein
MDYKCNICNKNYTEQKSYLKHYNKRHAHLSSISNNFSCNLCKYVKKHIPSTKLFHLMKHLIDNEMVANLDAIFQFNITNNENSIISIWTVDMKTNEENDVYPGPSKNKPDCIIMINEEDLIKMAEGKLNHIMAFISGKLKVDGSILIAPRLQEILDKVNSILHMDVNIFTCSCVLIDSVDCVLEKTMSIIV